MILLHPLPDPFHNCPYCQVPLEVTGWHIPGMRMLADLRCLTCNRTFFGDLLAGHGLFYPMLIDKDSGHTHDHYQVRWFADWLRDSYANRENKQLALTVETLRPIRRPLLLNCLDVLYGHSLLKLLNAQYYIDHSLQYDLVLLIPRFLRWMVPEGAATIWTVDLPLRQGTQWNDWLAAELHKLLEQFEEVWLSVALSHPHPEDYDIVRFTRVTPFPMDEWQDRLDQPTVTFIWREDRLWLNDDHLSRPQTLRNQVWRQLIGRKPDLRQRQSESILELAEELRQQVKGLRFVVVGLGVPGGLPDWIDDLRTQRIDAAVEQMWCEQYARSHIVVGIHGSNMLLPSAHAGATIELVPSDRWGNIGQDILAPVQDGRETMVRYLFLPLITSGSVVAEMATALFYSLPYVLLNTKRLWNDHTVIQSNPQLFVHQRQRMKGSDS